MALASRPLINAMVSHAQVTGQFRRVNQFEPKSAPGDGLSAALWVQYVGPARGLSSLDRTSLRVVFTLRIFQNMLLDPPDSIDPAVLDATDALMNAYSGDFTLGGLVMEVDLLGAYGNPLEAQAGHVNIDGKMYRAVDINIPLILTDVYVQEA